MASNAEKNSNPTEIEQSTPHNGLYKMFVSQLTNLHAVRSEEALACGFGRKDLVRSVGETWFINPQYGEGVYWFYLIDDDTIVVSMDITFSQHMKTHIDTVAYLGFGLYEHDMPRYCSPECAGSGCKLIGSDWQGGLYCTALEPNKRLASASITIAPLSVQRYADVLHCDTETLRRAIRQLAVSGGVPGLPSALRGLNITYPTASVAEAYYRAKVIECLALMMSGVIKNDNSADIAHSTHASDRTCVECACSYINDNLCADLSTKALCGITHVSEGKLISAFRNMKSSTPQGYVREQRLEQGRRLLLESDHSIRKIAQTAGYRNQGAFTDAFKRAYGTTPRTYRKITLAHTKKT